MLEFLNRFFGSTLRPPEEVLVCVCASGEEGHNAELRIFWMDAVTPEYHGVFEGLHDIVLEVWNALGIDVDAECDIEEERGGNYWHFHWEGTVLR